MPKYKNRDIATNKNSLYEDLFEKRGVTKINQYRTMPFSGLDFDTIMVQEYRWRSSDSLQKLSRTFYSTYNYWWVIGLVNKKPTDAHYTIGDKVYIPADPSIIAESVGK